MLNDKDCWYFLIMITHLFHEQLDANFLGLGSVRYKGFRET